MMERIENIKKFKIGGTLKTWIAVAAVLISFGFSLGVYASQTRQIKNDISDIQNKKADKVVVDLQFKGTNESLSRIEASIQRLEGKLDKHLDK